MLIKTTVTITSLAIICLNCWRATAQDGALSYEYIGVIEKYGDCPAGENCLLSPYLSVAHFKDRLRKGRQVAVLLEDYFYCHEDSDNVYRVPTGFETDFLSIPEIARGLIRPKDFMSAAVIHDWLYAVGEEGKRPVADRIFLDVLNEEGAPIDKRNIMHRAVRMGGNQSYGDEKEWRFIDLETMMPATTPPFEKPDTAVFSKLDCTDTDAFDRLRKETPPTKSYETVTNDFFENEGFRKK